jgi:hypothetical protein
MKYVEGQTLAARLASHAFPSRGLRPRIMKGRPLWSLVLELTIPKEPQQRAASAEREKEGPMGMDVHQATIVMRGSQ